MIIRPSVLCAGLVVLVFSTVGQAHQLDDGSHKHVTQPTAYGKNDRLGHSVNGSNGNITIWSPTTLNRYGASNAVRFARPTPYTGQPARQSAKQPSNQTQGHSNRPSSSASQSNIPRIKSMAPSRYGKDYKRDYGK